MELDGVPELQNLKRLMELVSCIIPVTADKLWVSGLTGPAI